MLFLTAPVARAGQDRLSGNWLIRFFDNGEILSFWMVKIDAKANGSLEATADFRQSQLQNFKADGDVLSFAILFNKQPVEFAFAVPKGKFKKLFGTMRVEGQLYAVQLEATKLESLKDHQASTELPLPKGSFKQLKEQIAKGEDELGVFEIAEALVGAADKDKVPAADLKAALAPALQAAKRYGEEWYQEVAIVVARKLATRAAFAAMAEDLARNHLTAIGAGATAEKQLRALGVLTGSLRLQDKKDELATVQARVDALEVKGHKENEKAGLGFEPVKAKEHKGNRVVLVELFTGAACPPCVAADLGFEGLGKTYGTGAVVLLQYHLHIPRPDPLANPDTLARAEYYGEKIEGTPTVFFNGKPGPEGGGSRGAAGLIYKEYCKVIDPLLAEKTKAKLSASAMRTGDKIAIQAEVAGVDRPGDKLRMRVALVEKWVHFPGPNGLSYHAHVVRALPGGAKGFAVTKAVQEEKLTVDLDELRQTAGKHLEKFANLEGIRPFNFRELHVVVFLQDDATQEVLQALEVAVK
jgi:hypothetical protein